MLMTFVIAAFASDGIRTISLDQLVFESNVVARVRVAEPPVKRDTIQVPLPVEPARTMEWSESVHGFEVLELLHAADDAQPTGAITAIGRGARQHFDRSVVYEVGERSRGMMHIRYEGALQAKEVDAGAEILVFLGSPRTYAADTPHGKAWTEEYASHWILLGRDAVSERKKVERAIRKAGPPMSPPKAPPKAE